MGTPTFSIPTLNALIENGYQVALVVTQQDKPKGRGGLLAAPPVKEAALTHGLALAQPARLKDQEFMKMLREAAPEVIVVVAYGKILPVEILTLPKYGCINLHASLLPKYRGAAPIQWAIMKGEESTGVTTILMDEGMDTGDILLQRRVEIGQEENFGSLYIRLAEIGAELVLVTLNLLPEGKIKPCPQDHGQATYAPPLAREDEIIDWHRPAKAITNQVRALDPWPGARTFYRGETLKIWRSRTLTGIFNGLPGEVLDSSTEGVVVQAGEGAVMVLELQLAGGRKLTVAEFLRGHPLPKGTILGKH